MTAIASNEPCWRVSGGRRLRPAPFLVAGIVNVTPDSFSDGGFCLEREAALERVRQVVNQGADLVDLGAESTRPGARDIGPEEEWRRLNPVLEDSLAYRADLARKRGDSFPFALSVDTFRAQTAARALELGPALSREPVDVINDISGASFEPALLEVLASFKPGYVLGHCPARPGHMQEAAHYDDVVEELLAWFTSRMTALVKAGLPEECIVLDPCIGFGKTLEHDLAIFAALDRFKTLGRPLFFGISRKSFFTELAGLAPGERDAATQVLTGYLAHKGVAVHRVHQVAQTVATLRIIRALP